MGNEIALPWQVETTYQTKPILLEYFQINGEPAGIFADQVLALKSFYTEDIQYSLLDHQLLFWTFVITIVLVTAFISLLDRTSYLLSAGAICLMLTQMQFDALQVLPEYLVMIIIGIFLICSYYFQAFNTTASIGIRLFVSFMLYALLIIGITLTTPVIQPSIVALGNGLFGPLILSLLFLLFIAGENIFTLFKLTTSAQPGKKGLWHFTFFGLVYLGVCFLLFVDKEKGLPFDLDYLDTRILLLFSVFSAYMSFDQRHDNYEKREILLLKNTLFPVGAVLLFITYSFAVNSANDSLQNVLDWAIIGTHFGMGCAYFIYAMINFVPELIEGQPVWRAFYLGQRTAILTLRLMGVVLCVGVYFYLEKEPYYQAQAAQFNIQGDQARQISSNTAAKNYFDQAVFNDLYAFKANYTLFQMAEKNFDLAESKNRLEKIAKKKANPLATVALANAYTEEKRLFNALNILKETDAVDAYLESNLGLAYYRYSNFDSAFVHFENSGLSEAKTNQFATEFTMADRLVLEPSQPADDLSQLVNQQALANWKGWNQAFSYEMRPNSIAEKDDVYYLYNAATSQHLEDYQPLIKAIDLYLANPANDLYSSFLLTAKAMAHYHAGEVNLAFKTLDMTINRNAAKAGFETYLKAIWSFDQGQAEQTVIYTNLAQLRGYQDEQLKAFVNIVQNLNTYTEKANISDDLEKALQTTEQESKIAALKRVASLNAFDAANTLKAIESLKSLAVDDSILYDLLLAATEVNEASPELLEAYIYQSEYLNLSSFANSALERYSLKVPYEEYFRVAKRLNEIREKK